MGTTEEVAKAAAAKAPSSSPPLLEASTRARRVDLRRGPCTPERRSPREDTPVGSREKEEEEALEKGRRSFPSAREPEVRREEK